MKIISDNTDYYDEMLKQYGNNGIVLDRTANMNKIESIKKLKNLGFETIDITSVRNARSDKLVVYTDINSHCGKGKTVMYRDEALGAYCNKFCSEYYYNNPKTHKLLFVGGTMYSLIINNVGLVETEVEQFAEIGGKKIVGLDSIIYSIDYVVDGSGKSIACSLNEMPILKHLVNIEEVLPASIVVNKINNFI